MRMLYFGDDACVLYVFLRSRNRAKTVFGNRSFSVSRRVCASSFVVNASRERPSASRATSLYELAHRSSESSSSLIPREGVMRGPDLDGREAAMQADTT